MEGRAAAETVVLSMTVPPVAHAQAALTSGGGEAVQVASGVDPLGDDPVALDPRHGAAVADRENRVADPLDRPQPRKRLVGVECRPGSVAQAQEGADESRCAAR